MAGTIYLSIRTVEFCINTFFSFPKEVLECEEEKNFTDCVCRFMYTYTHTHLEKYVKEA